MFTLVLLLVSCNIILKLLEKLVENTHKIFLRNVLNEATLGELSLSNSTSSESCSFLCESWIFKQTFVPYQLHDFRRQLYIILHIA